MRRPVAGPALVAVATVAAAGLTACSSSFGMPRGASEQGRDIFNLWQVFMVAGLVVGAIVYGLIGWSLVRYRRRRSDDDEALGRQFDGHVPLEIVYTAIPVVIVIALFTMSFRTEQRVADLAPDPAVTVHAEAFAWGWRFTYEGQDVTVVSDPSVASAIQGCLGVAPRRALLYFSGSRYMGMTNASRSAMAGSMFFRGCMSVSR